MEEFIAKLKKPRRIMLLVMAGKPVDDFINTLLPFVEKGDIIIDGGNSHFPDTNRRTRMLAEKGIRFVGTGVSGGEEGARYGPSLMPGGNEEAWPYIKDIFQAVAAKSDGEPCCDWVGDEGAGHYVKMVHNGIEYGDMQLICEAYDIMKRGLGMSDKEMSDVFAEWNKGVLDSFLIEITRDVLRFNDDDGTPLVEKILDSAGQKGTGKWTAINALDLGMPVTLIGEAVFARCLSSIKQERGRAAKVLDGPTPSFKGDKKQFLANLEQALYASKIISYCQGFMLIQNVCMFSLSTRFCSVQADFSLGCQRIRLEAEQAFHCPYVARGLHHPLCLPKRHHKRISQKSGSRELTVRRLLQQGHSPCSRRLERYRGPGRQMGYTHTSFQHRFELLRWLPLQGSARQLAPSPA